MLFPAGENKREGGAFADGAPHLYAALVGLGYLLYQRQAQPQSAAFTRQVIGRLVEGVIKGCKSFLRYPRAGVFDAEPEASAAFLQGYFYGAPGLAEGDGVLYEVFMARAIFSGSQLRASAAFGKAVTAETERSLKSGASSATARIIRAAGSAGETSDGQAGFSEAV